MSENFGRTYPIVTSESEIPKHKYHGSKRATEKICNFDIVRKS